MAKDNAILRIDVVRHKTIAGNWKSKCGLSYMGRRMRKKKRIRRDADFLRS